MNNKFNENINDIVLTDNDYKGVIYEPSDNAKKYTKNNTKTNIKIKNNNNKINQTKIKKAQNFNFNLFIWTTVAIGVAIFLIVATITYSSLSSYIGVPAKKNTTSDNNINLNLNNNNEDPSVLSSKTNKNIVGIIKSINYENGIFIFSSLDSNKSYTLKSKPSSIFKDKFGNTLSMSELNTGDIVDFSFNDDNTLDYVSQNKESFFLENVSNIKIDTTLKNLTLNDTIFNISDNVSVLKNNEPYDLLDISNLDILNIKGYNKTIYFIELKKGAGILKLENKPNLNKGIIEIDRNIFKSLDEINSISLSEGKHKVVIRSDDSVSFVKEIDIISDTETILDLSQIQNKSATLFINSNVTDYTLYVNGIIETSREPLKLQYGAYTIKAEKEGYTPFETQISINKPTVNININLEKIEKVGKISINSTPDNASVFVNNSLIGYTPLSYKLPQGVHTITIKKEGYNDFVLSSVTIGDEESSFNITMHKSVKEDTTTTRENNTEPVVSEPTI
ncbi:PEGA domain-containing protein [uncultured Tyzzerella sp.]|uniref:PEGA domain-containing protein n=1 Tax=uncultured Tyzzerella sp. TaxID=2321398 RepID=UPI0029437EC0|nr:PEGA domain-containing protein [uncultured Tyzzerella sp.]